MGGEMCGCHKCMASIISHLGNNWKKKESEERLTVKSLNVLVCTKHSSFSGSLFYNMSFSSPYLNPNVNSN